MLALEDAHTRSDSLDRYAVDILTRWEKFRLLDPTLGPVSPADSSVARTAGAEILIALRNIDIVVVNLDENGKPFHGRDPAPFDPRLDSSPIRSCAAIWKNGRIYRRPGD